MSIGYPIFANNLWATLANPATATDTTLTLTAGQGARFPTIPAGCWIYVTLCDANNDLEVVTVISRSGDVLTVERAADDTIARSWAALSRVEARFNAGYLTDIKNFVNQTIDAGGYTMTGPLVLSGSAIELNEVINKTYVDTKLFQKSLPWMAPVGFAMVQNWSVNLFSLGWNGTGVDISVDSTWLGTLWTSSNFNPAAYATLSATCQWNAGIVEIGLAGSGTFGSAGTLDNGNPWLVEGLRVDASGVGPYLRSTYLRNN